MKKIRCYFLLSVLLTIGCTSENYKVLDFNTFEITVPEDWSKIDVKGIDSYIGGFATKSGDSIYFDYGKHGYKMDIVLKVNDLKEYKKLDSIGFNVEDLIFSKHPGIDQNQGTFHREYYMYDSIGKYQAKISVPKKDNFGVTGIFFESLPDDNNLYIYGSNLKQSEQKLLLESFKTIKIK